MTRDEAVRLSMGNRRLLATLLDQVDHNQPRDAYNARNFTCSRGHVGLVQVSRKKRLCALCELKRGLA